VGPGVVPLTSHFKYLRQGEVEKVPLKPKGFVAGTYFFSRAHGSVPPSAVTFRDAIPRRCRLRGLLAILGALALEDRLIGCVQL
jgi:hypothetical protein